MRIFAARPCWGAPLAVRLVDSQHASALAARLRPIACEMVRARGVKKLTRMEIWAGRGQLANMGGSLRIAVGLTYISGGEMYVKSLNAQLV